MSDNTLRSRHHGRRRPLGQHASATRLVRRAGL